MTATGGEISTDAGKVAVGVCSSGCGAGNDTNRAMNSSESLGFRLTDPGKTAQCLALGLMGTTAANTTVAVSITFKRNGVTVDSLITSALVNSTMPTSPQLANLAPAPAGTLFDEVVVQPVGSSLFYAARLHFSTAGACAP
ncbi:MAG: hypothetical protein HUU13_15860 [Burkholderiaceae bacterium]|nr:hypothetical protein [Burkholderiaceae bacterium]